MSDNHFSQGPNSDQSKGFSDTVSIRKNSPASLCARVFVSKAIQITNYSIIEREGLAVIFVLRKFRHYLLRGKFTIVLDHKALKYIFNKPNAEGRIARWKLLLSEYDYEICDHPRKKHVNVDLLSRAYDDEGKIAVDDTFLDEDLMILSINSLVAKEYKEIWDFISEEKYPEGMRTREKQTLAQRSHPHFGWNVVSSRS